MNDRSTDSFIFYLFIYLFLFIQRLCSFSVRLKSVLITEHIDTSEQVKLCVICKTIKL